MAAGMSAAAIGTRIPTHSRSTVLGDSQVSLLDCSSGDPIPLPDKNGCYLRRPARALHGGNPDWFAHSRQRTFATACASQSVSALIARLQIAEDAIEKTRRPP